MLQKKYLKILILSSALRTFSIRSTKIKFKKILSNFCDYLYVLDCH